ncbi:MAG: hypothetical protein BWZ00_01892 [Bacteroidetes bacterium ADurb.BinA174]|nr:MAG: hypothetical protein BWZ00_01892 [Bacteroidetes bacterium ADurb.BinA174]
MPKIIISDTSCLIILSNIAQLELLHKMYGEIVITPEILEEYQDVVPDWIVVQTVSDKYRQRILELQIDKGEASAIALALEIPGSTLILDDEKARKVARSLNLIFTGTIGVIVKAKLSGIIPEVKSILEMIKKTNFRISTELEIAALKLAGEL